MPQRTFSPRTFMGDRGIILDSYGRVLKNESFSSYDNEKKILAPKAWKTSNSQFSNSIIENYSHEVLELKIPFFTAQSPGFAEPITPPTRTHNPITLNQAFTSDIADSIHQGAEIAHL
eukprot:gene12219-14309_t